MGTWNLETAKLYIFNYLVFDYHTFSLLLFVFAWYSINSIVVYQVLGKACQDAYILRIFRNVNERTKGNERKR